MKCPQQIWSGTGLCEACACMLILVVVHAARAETPPADAVESEQIEQLSEEAAHALSLVYEYDRTIPLEARTVELRERDGRKREKIVFRGVQGFLVPGFLEYPATGDGPRPCVLLLHGWSGSRESWWQ